MPVALDNDGICAAIGEWRMGAGQGYDNVVYVTVSTGIGGGVIAGGRVLRGHRGIAGHVGHMSIVVDGELCLCGCRGCFEAYASGSSFTARAVAVAKHEPVALPSPVDAPSVFAAAAAGNPAALALVHDEANFLGQGFANLLHLYSPEILIMGGGMANQFDMLKDGIVARMRASSMPAYSDVPLVKAALGGDSGIIGAAALVFDENLRAGHTRAP
jgi:glucokinase